MKNEGSEYDETVIKSFRPAFDHDAKSGIFSTCFDNTGCIAAALIKKCVFFYHLDHDKIEPRPILLERNSYKNVVMPLKRAKSNYFLYSYIEKSYSVSQMDMSLKEIRTLNGNLIIRCF
jgi:hypothetical protein